MSIAISTGRMGTPFHEFKKQATFFLREKIRSARLALTDVTTAELLTEEVTNGNPWAPDAKTMSFISRAAFEIDDFWRIVNIIHNRLAKFNLKQWRESYNSLVLLEHLLTHGPESFADEFLCDREIIQRLGSFQLVDENGFNWGLSVRKKTERVLKLLEKGNALKEERNQARKITRGIQGFGSLNYRPPHGCKHAFDQSSDSVAILEKMNQSFNSEAETVNMNKKMILKGGDRFNKTYLVNDIYVRIEDKEEEEEEENLNDEDECKRFLHEDLNLLLSAKKQKEEHPHPFLINEQHMKEPTLLLSQS